MPPCGRKGIPSCTGLTNCPALESALGNRESGAANLWGVLMVEIYYYAKTENLSNILDCGLKLSACYNREVVIDGERVICFSGLLNPKDDMELYKSSEYTCLKIQAKNEKCFIADRFLHENANKLESSEMELYYKSVVPINKYIFGAYRLPECLITTTILPGEAAVLDKRMDSPVIYSNSEELYINNVLQDLREQLAESDDFLLYYFFDRLAEEKQVEKLENSHKGTAVFKTGSGNTYCIKKPQMEKIKEKIRL